MHFLLQIVRVLKSDVYTYSQLDGLLLQVGGDLDGKLDENSANLILDTKPSKVVSNELTVSLQVELSIN